VASDALNAVLLEVRRLETRRDKKFIHSTRVAFRRWYAVWKVLKKDGWQRPDAKKKGFKELKKAYRLLGAVRDWDMTIGLARKGQVPEPIVKQWLKERSEVRKSSNKRLEKLALRKLVKKMKSFLDKRYQELRVEAIRNESLKPESAYKHIDRYLRDREVKSRDLADDAHTLPQLHALRLSVKSWRYILVEFFGVSSLLLVDTQQTLGQINDIDRFIQVLERELTAQQEKRQAGQKKDSTAQPSDRPAEAADGSSPQLLDLQATNKQAAHLSENASEPDDFGLQAILEETVDRRNRLIAGFLEKGHDALPYGFRPGARHSEPQKFAERARSI
jgi:CHAD domain-containing protein